MPDANCVLVDGSKGSIACDQFIKWESRSFSGSYHKIVFECELPNLIGSDMEESPFIEHIVANIGIVDVLDIYTEWFALMECTTVYLNGFGADGVEQFQSSSLSIILATLVQLYPSQYRTTCPQDCIVHVTIDQQMIAPSWILSWFYDNIPTK